MAPLPPNNTDRVYLRYFTGYDQHEMMIRPGPSAGSGAGMSFFLDFLTAIAPLLPTAWVTVSARFHAEGADFSLPIGLGPLEGFSGTGGALPSIVQSPREWVYVGRSLSQGRRWELSIYGLNAVTDDSYRYDLGGVSGAFTDGRDVIALAALQGQIVAIDQSEFIVYDYVNVNFNSHWETERRG